MENTVTIVSPSVINLETARNELVAVAGKTGEVLNAYAKAMCQAFNLTDSTGKVTTPWWELRGKLMKGVKEERAQFAKAMGDKFDTGTIDVYWGRVKDASGRVKSTNKVTGGSKVDDENIRTLKTMLNRIDNAEVETAPLSFKVVHLLLQVADQMGIDTKAYAIAGDTDEE